MENLKSKSKQAHETTTSLSSIYEIKDLRQLFEEELKDMYWTETALIREIPIMITNATSDKLLKILSEHLDVTHEHIKRLEIVFNLIGKKVEGKKCSVMSGLILETNKIINTTERGATRDAGIILMIQKIEHYGIATYGTMMSFAEEIGENKVGHILYKTLIEQKRANDALSLISIIINSDASENDSKLLENAKTQTLLKKEKV